MKIVFLTEHLFGETVGGVESHIFYLGKELARLGHTVDVIICIASANNSIRSEIVIEDTSSGGKLTFHRHHRKSISHKLIKHLSRFNGSGLGMALKLIEKLSHNVFARHVYRVVKTLRPDFVHQHDYFANILVSKCLARSLPVVLTNHTGQYLYLERSRIGRVVQRVLLSHYKLIIAPSEELRPNDSRSFFLSNGADDETFCPPRSEVERTQLERLRISTNPEGRFVLICPRRWAPTKGIIYFVRALMMLEPEVLDKVLVLFAGSDSDDFPAYTREVIRLLETLPTDTFRLLGNLSHSQLCMYFNLSDVCVIPSLMEATSLAAMEAMACGVPVLSTNVGGMPDVIRNSNLGWLIPPEDASAIATVITAIIRSRAILIPMKGATRAYISETRSWKAIAGKTVELYETHVTN